MLYDMSLAKEAYELASRWHHAQDADPFGLKFKMSDVEGFNSNQIGKQSFAKRKSKIYK